MITGLKHLRGRHDQKLHGNRGLAARGARVGESATSTATASAVDITPVYVRIKGKLIAAGRSWDRDRRKYLFGYLEWAYRGKKGAAPKPEGTAIRAANHIRRAVEADPDVKALGYRAEKPAPKPRTPKTKPEKDTAPANIRTEEKKWDHSPDEEAILYDSKGDIAFRKGGKGYTVAFSDEEWERMKGLTLTHNHPGAWVESMGSAPMDISSKGRGLSTEDWDCFWNAGLNSIRAIARKRIFEVTRPPSMVGQSKEKNKEMMEKVKEIDREVRGDFMREISGGKKSIEDAEQSHALEVMKRFCSKYSIPYKIIPRVENLTPGDTIEWVMKAKKEHIRIELDKSFLTPIYTPESVAAWEKEHPGKTTKETHTGGMIAFMIPQEIAQQLVLSCPGASPVEDLHITLVFLGDTTALGPDDRAKVEQAISETVGRWSRVTGDINGVGIFFDQEDSDVLYQNFDGVGVPGIRQELIDRLKLHGFEPPENHGFTPHITLAYAPKGIALEGWGKNIPGVTFNDLCLCWGDDRKFFPLTGTRIKHLRGRHDQKLHGNRGIMVDRKVEESSGGYSDADVIHIANKLTAAGRTMTLNRVKFIRAYLDWKNAGKVGKAPDPKTFGDDVPRAANHIRRAVEGSKSIPAGRSSKTPPTPPEPIPSPSPAPSPKSPRVFDEGTSTALVEHVSGQMRKRGWASTPAKEEYARAYVDWISGGRKAGEEPAIPEKLKGTAAFIRNEVDTHPVVRAADKFMGTTPPDHGPAPKPSPIPAPTPGPKTYHEYPDDAYSIHRDFHDDSGWKDWVGNLKPGETMAIKNYVGRPGEGYVAKAEQLNDMLRNDRYDPSIKSGTTAMVKNMDSALGKGSLHRDMTLYRGIDYDKMYYGVSDGTYRVGGKFTDKGFASTSPKIGTSTGGRFLRGSYPVVMRIKAAKGSKGAYVSWNELDNPYMHESEFLLPRNSTYTIDKMGYETIRGRRVAVFEMTLE